MVKVVVKVSMNDQKSRTKALKIVAGLPGVESAGFHEEEKNQIEVVGEFDSVQHTSLLRKKIGHADLVTVEDKKEEKKEEKQEEPPPPIIQPLVWPYGTSVNIIQFQSMRRAANMALLFAPSCESSRSIHERK